MIWPSTTQFDTATWLYHPIEPNPAVAARAVFAKSKPSKKYSPHIGHPIYQIKADEMPFPRLKKLFRFDKKVCVGRTLNSDNLLALNFGESLREFGEILGKYRI